MAFSWFIWCYRRQSIKMKSTNHKTRDKMILLKTAPYEKAISSISMESLELTSWVRWCLEPTSWVCRKDELNVLNEIEGVIMDFPWMMHIQEPFFKKKSITCTRNLLFVQSPPLLLCIFTKNVSIVIFETDSPFWILCMFTLT